jgi:hypothetical protein
MQIDVQRPDTRFPKPIGIAMAVEAVTFGVASIVHLTVDPFRAAAVPEAVIGAVLFLAAVAVITRQTWSRGIGYAGTIFATLGTMIGLAAVTTGAHPRGPGDIAYHATILAALIGTLIAMTRTGVER